MRLLSLQLRSFRAHAETDLELAPRINVFVGENGAGKTNLVEAVHYLGLGKSFLTSTDSHVVRRGADHLDVQARIVGEHRAETSVRVVVVPGEGKRAFIGGAPLDRLADLIGTIPLVILSPADHELTAGGPSERRRFLDSTLSQAFPVYLDDLVTYRRTLKQRNALLQQLRRGRAVPSGTLDAWDEELAVRGTRLCDRRREFLSGFGAFVARAYEMLGELGGEPTLDYAPSVDGDTDAFRQALARTFRRGRDLGRTLVGPHLDEVDFKLDGFELRPYASQGQHRTFGLAVRFAQALFLRDHLDEPPVLLLDDVFGPLDPERSDRVLSVLASGEIGQSLITAARAEPFSTNLTFDGDHASFHVEQGAVSPSRSTAPS